MNDRGRCSKPFIPASYSSADTSTKPISAASRMNTRLRDRCTDTVKHVVTLLCTVRGCRRPLSRESNRFVCERGHSFDVARSGYLNLLQPQDRRSANPGDSKEAVA